jgi:hypothetical protein
MPGLPLTEEEIRAREWREARSRRVEFQSQLHRKLAGSPSSRQALADDWKALSPEDCDDQEIGQVEPG